MKKMYYRPMLQLLNTYISMS